MEASGWPQLAEADLAQTGALESRPNTKGRSARSTDDLPRRWVAHVSPDVTDTLLRSQERSHGHLPSNEAHNGHPEIFRMTSGPSEGRVDRLRRYGQVVHHRDITAARRLRHVHDGGRSERAGKRMMSVCGRRPSPAADIGL